MRFAWRPQAGNGPELNRRRRYFDYYRVAAWRQTV